MDSINIFRAIMFLTGAIILACASFQIRSILRLVTGKSLTNWTILMVMIYFFLVGYIAMLSLGVMALTYVHTLFGIIALSGAIFVYLVVIFARLDLKKMAETSKLLEIKNQEFTKINAELDQFVYSTAHDLRAPLASIMGLLNLVEPESKQESVNVYLNLIRDSANQLDQFINDITDHLRNARLDVQRDKIDFHGMIDQILEDLKFLPLADKIEKIITVEPNILFISDFNRIRVLFQNLISNAIRYQNSHIDNPFLKINIELQDDKALIDISDNGKGIEQQHIDKVFEMFYRASHQSKGAGLGLYIVKEIVNKLEGNITVESSIDVGTKFTISIPNLNNSMGHSASTNH